MQKSSVRRSNDERTQATRAALLAAARDCFVRDGYAGTSTPAIVAAAGITRGALYHHFADKKDLFRHVVEQEARAVADAIEAALPVAGIPAAGVPADDVRAREALMVGSIAYFDAMAVSGRTRLLLREGPAVLGPEI